MLSIRGLTLQEMVFVMEVSNKEGWNSGLYDGMTYYRVDPDGFFLGERDGCMVGGIVAARCADGLTFIGNHFVLPPYRGQGYGKSLWERALERAGDDITAVNGLTDGRDFYESYGFRYVCNVIRYKGTAFDARRLSEYATPAYDIDFAKLAEFDARFFGADRTRFLRIWLESPGADCMCLIKRGEILSWACMRRCRDGWRLGPVYAENYESAWELTRHMAAKTLSERVYIDAPENNTNAIKLAFSLGLTPVGARARMFKNGHLDESYNGIYGFTTLDIG